MKIPYNHTDKSAAAWVGSDGVISFIYPDKLSEAIGAHTYTMTDDSFGSSDETVYTAAEIAINSYILWYIRSSNAAFVPGHKVPVLYATAAAPQVLLPITFAKYPKVHKVPLSDNIFLTYWTNVDPDNHALKGEPYGDDGTISEDYTRALFYCLGRPTLAVCSRTGRTDTFMLFEEPQELALPPTHWSGDTKQNEPVVDIAAGGLYAKWKPDPTP